MFGSAISGPASTPVEISPVRRLKIPPPGNSPTPTSGRRQRSSFHEPPFPHRRFCRTVLAVKALRIWFAPGRKYGQELVYPKAQAAELAKSVGRGVLALPAELPGDIGLLAWMVAEPNGAAARVPVAAAVSEPRAAPVNATSAASPAQPVARPTQAGSLERSQAPRESRLAANCASRDNGAASSSASVQSRARAREPKAAVAAPAMITSPPKTASYAALVAVMGLLRIGWGTLLRILALQLERR